MLQFQRFLVSLAIESNDVPSVLLSTRFVYIDNERKHSEFVAEKWSKWFNDFFLVVFSAFVPFSFRQEFAGRWNDLI